MAVYESKRGVRPHHPPASLLAAMMMIMAAVILINANGGGAAVLVKSNATYGCISGREECLIAEDMELESLFMEYGSHVVRVLQDAPSSASQQAGGGTNIPCNNGKGKPYQCKPHPTPNPPGPCHPPNTYKRGCH